MKKDNWIVKIIYVVGVLYLSACSPVVQNFESERSDARYEDDHFLTGDNAKLPLKQWWNDDSEKTEAIIIALHGFNDYSNAFATVGPYFAKRNIALIAYDQRGFGKAPKPGIWAGKSNLIQDLIDVIFAVHEKHPNTPIYLLGESMGGAVVINTIAQKHPEFVNGIILSAPAIWGDETMNNFYRTTLWLAAHTIPGNAFTGESLGILPSDNIPLLIALGKDPLVIKKTRVDAIYGIVHLMDDAFTNIDKVDVPLLMLYGAKDQVIPKAPVQKALRKINTENRIAYYPDGYHMLLRDLKADIVLSDIVSWIKYRKDALPSGYDKLVKTRTQYLAPETAEESTDDAQER